MDFVPTKSTKVRVSEKKSVSKKNSGGSLTRQISTNQTVKAIRTTQNLGVRRSQRNAQPSSKPRAKVEKKTQAGSEAAVFSTERTPKLGMIEELGPKFVRTDVPKRPLSRASHFEVTKTELTEAKAKKIGNKKKTVAEKPAMTLKKTEDKSIYTPPKTPFINAEKIEKRPLSKNVYHKKVEAPKEEPKGPVTIISKPEKQAHVGLIVTIILTIILGAAAGTVAFLLLPK